MNWIYQYILTKPNSCPNLGYWVWPSGWGKPRDKWLDPSKDNGFRRVNGARIGNVAMPRYVCQKEKKGDRGRKPKKNSPSLQYLSPSGVPAPPCLLVLLWCVHANERSRRTMVDSLTWFSEVLKGWEATKIYIIIRGQPLAKKSTARKKKE